MVTITDDDMVEDDETFEIQFTELDPSECNMDVGSGTKCIGTMLSPITNKTVSITIIDNGKPEIKALL